MLLLYSCTVNLYIINQYNGNGLLLLKQQFYLVKVSVVLSRAADYRVGVELRVAPRARVIGGFCEKTRHRNRPEPRLPLEGERTSVTFVNGDVIFVMKCASVVGLLATRAQVAMADVATRRQFALHVATVGTGVATASGAGVAPMGAGVTEAPRADVTGVQRAGGVGDHHFVAMGCSVGRSGVFLVAVVRRRRRGGRFLVTMARRAVATHRLGHHGADVGVGRAAAADGICH